MGHWYVNPHPRLSMQSLKSYTRFHIWFHIGQQRHVRNPSVWAKVVNYNDTGYSTIQSSYLRHLASGLVFLYPDIRRSYDDITVPTERGIDEPERKNVDALTNTKQVVTLRKM
jgi:hypothetical protein